MPTELPGSTILTNEAKIIAFKGRNPTRSNIVIHNTITRQINVFNHLGNLVPYEKEKHIDNKIIQF
jgi:hypothetical protein